METRPVITGGPISRRNLLPGKHGQAYATHHASNHAPLYPYARTPPHCSVRDGEGKRRGKRRVLLVRVLLVTAALRTPRPARGAPPIPLPAWPLGMGMGMALIIGRSVSTLGCPKNVAYAPPGQLPLRRLCHWRGLSVSGTAPWGWHATPAARLRNCLKNRPEDQRSRARWISKQAITHTPIGVIGVYR